MRWFLGIPGSLASEDHKMEKVNIFGNLITPIHISDGVLSWQILTVGWVVTGILLFFTLRRIKAEEVPSLSVITAAFFVASLFHFPVGPTSVHFILNGLVGVLLGPLCYLSIFIGVVLQAFLFGHGGVTVIGVNTLNMGISALSVWGVFKLGKRFVNSKSSIKLWLLGALAGGLAVALAVLFASLMLYTTGIEFANVIKALILFHIPIIFIEAVVVASIVSFFSKVKPEVLKTKLQKEVGK